MENVKTLVTSHKQLEFYKRAYQLSLQLHRLTENFPKHELYSLADQIRRASRSICANIAEGFSRGKASDQEFKRFLQIALSSIVEMEVWLDYCRDLNYCDAAVVADLQNEYEQIAKMVGAFQQRIKN